MEDIINRHERIVLQFSGGKDSLACLLLCAPWLHKIDVVWVNPGAPYPGVQDYMDALGQALPHYHEVRGHQPDWIAARGVPVDVVPLWNTAFGQATRAGARQRVQPFTECCWQNLWQPLRQAVKDHGATLVIRGSKKADAIVGGTQNGFVDDDGIEYLFPVNDMSDDEVLALLHRRGVVLPSYYDEGLSSSPDCWNCCAYSLHAGEKFRHLKTHHPGLWAQIAPTVAAIHDSIQRDSAWMREE